MAQYHSVTIINDCRDDNAMNRQAARAATLLKLPVSTIGVANDLEAAGNMIDTLDALTNEPGIILANVAPRHGKAKKWPNGTPFCYFWINDSLIISTVDGYLLSLIKKFGLVDSVKLMDVGTVIDAMIERQKFPAKYRDLVVRSQFRSYQFVPRVAAWLAQDEEIPAEEYSLSEVADAPHAIWWVDNFGNCKTTMLPADLDGNAQLETAFGTLKVYERLKDVPYPETGLITGSSGLDNHRFLELVIQGQSFAYKYDVKSGHSVFGDDSVGLEVATTKEK